MYSLFNHSHHKPSFTLDTTYRPLRWMLPARWQHLLTLYLHVGDTLELGGRAWTWALLMTTAGATGLWRLCTWFRHRGCWRSPSVISHDMVVLFSASKTNVRLKHTVCQYHCKRTAVSPHKHILVSVAFCFWDKLTSVFYPENVDGNSYMIWLRIKHHKWLQKVKSLLQILKFHPFRNVALIGLYCILPRNPSFIF